ncbi:MAG: hypothetical protein RL721_934 [Candidatus Eisenbacteria bacterium]
MRKPVALALQVAVSVALLTLLLRQVPLADVGGALARLRPGTIALALTLVLVSYLGRAQRWAGLLARSGRALALAPAWGLTLLGVGYGLVTPGKVGEFARVVHLGVPRHQAFASVLWDRITDVLLLELLALPAFVLVPAWRGPVMWLFLAVVAATLVGVAVLESRRLQAIGARIVPPLAGTLARWQEASAGTLTSGAFRVGLAGGMFYYALNFAAAFLMVRDLAPDASPALMLGFPIIPLLGNLPIAFSGLGLREQVSALLFVAAGTDPAIGPAYSLAYFGLGTLVPGVLGLLLGATPWLRDAARPREAA